MDDFDKEYFPKTRKRDKLRRKYGTDDDTWIDFMESLRKLRKKWRKQIKKTLREAKDPCS